MSDIGYFMTFFVICIVTFLITIFGLTYRASIVYETNLRKAIAACESKGGVYVEHTVRHGKTTSKEKMGCFNKNALIDLE